MSPFHLFFPLDVGPLRVEHRVRLIVRRILKNVVFRQKSTAHPDCCDDVDVHRPTHDGFDGIELTLYEIDCLVD